MDDLDRISTRLVAFVFELLRHVGEDPVALSAKLPSIGTEPGPWVAWDDYLALIHHLGEVAGGAAGVARAMRETLPSAYADLRAFTGFFPSAIPLFGFVTHQLNRELIPSAWGLVETLSPTRFRVRYQIHEKLTPSRLYLQGTHTLIEVFPTHLGLPEATVDTLSLTGRTAEFAVEFPVDRAASRWGSYLMPATATPNELAIATTSLTQREQEVLRLVCTGLTNAEIATSLGTASSTVKSQISSILGKMDVANRTELAAVVSRRS